MSNPLFTVSAPERHRAPKLLGKFYTNDLAPLSRGEKHLICEHLNLAFEDELFFEATALACSEAAIGRPPDYTLINGRKFWIYRPDQQLSS
jgi:hypothetical protein